MLLSLTGEESVYSVTAPERSAFAERLASQLDAGGDTSLSRQIVDRIWVDVISGALETGERLPTVRQLAVDLGFNPKTVDGAYEELKKLGVLTDRPGEGTFVSLNAPNADERARRLKLDEIGRDAAHGVESLGYTIDDLIDALTELRSTRRSQRKRSQ